jgi:hypothetical protein
MKLSKRQGISGVRVKLTKEEMRHIHRSLKWGYKTELCNILGISNTMLTNYLKSKRVYNVETKQFEESYSLYREDYFTILDFIKTIPND